MHHFGAQLTLSADERFGYTEWTNRCQGRENGQQKRGFGNDAKSPCNDGKTT